MKNPKNALLGGKSRFLKIFTKVINEDPKNRPIITHRHSIAPSNLKSQYLNTHFGPNGVEVEDEGFFTVEDLITRIDFLINLPYEIAAYILMFVDFQTLCRMARVSRAWYCISRDNELWHSMYVMSEGWKTNIPKDVLTGDVDWKNLFKNRHTLATRWKKGECEKRYLKGHLDSVYCIQFDEHKIVTGSRDKTIKFWDINTGNCFQTLYGHDLSVLCLQYNEKIMVSGSSDTTIIIWDMQNYNQSVSQIRRLSGHSAGVLDICFDGNHIVSCSKDSTIKVWDVNTGECLRTLVGHRGPVNAVQLHGNRIISASGDALIKLWDLEKGFCIRDFIGHTRGLACVQFDGKWVVSGSNDKTIKIWDVETALCIRTLEGHTDLVRTIHFDEDKIVSGSYDQTVKVWDLKTGKQLLDFKNGHTSWVFDVQFSTTKIVSELSSLTVDASELMSNGELDSGKVTALKQQVFTLRHDLAEKSALLTNVQKQLNRHQPITMQSESTTGRVIEHLQAEIDFLKKELTESKSQIHAAKVARERSERQVQEHLASHQKLRLEINSLERMLERKERQSKELEEISKDLEKKNSDMKFERDNANTKSRQSELKVSDLHRKTQEALAAKEKAEYEYTLLSKEIQTFKNRYAKDIEIVKKEFKTLREEMNSTSRALEDVVLMTSIRIEELTTERKDEINNIESIHSKLQENQEKYAAKLLNEIEIMKKGVAYSNQKTIEHTEQVAKIKAETAGKLNWLKRIERAKQEA